MPSFFVVKSHNSSLPGEHWLAMYHSSPYYVDFLLLWFAHIDVFKHSVYHWSVTCHKQFDTAATLDIDICGDYCVALRLAVGRGVDMDSFVYSGRANRTETL